MILNRDVLIAKLVHLHDAIERVQAKRPDTLEQLLADRDLQDIITKNLERAVQVMRIATEGLADLKAFGRWAKDLLPPAAPAPPGRR